MLQKGVQTMGSPEFDKKHTRRIGLKLNKNTDADIILKLESCGNIQGYIKGLIRADIGEQTPGKTPNKMTIEDARQVEEEYNLILQMFREAGEVDS